MSWLDVPCNGSVARQTTATLLVAPLVVGWSVNLLLYGLFIAHFHAYYSSPIYQRDRASIKIMLWTVVLLGLLHVGVNVEEMTNAATSQQRDTISLLNGAFPFSFQPMLEGAIAAIVQVFLIRRAGQLFLQSFPRILFYIVMGSLVTLGLIGALMCGSLGFISSNETSDTEYVLPVSFSVATAIWLWPTAVCDVLVSLALYVQLSRRKAGFSASTDGIILALMRLALRTASYTAFFALFGAILSSAIPQSRLELADMASIFCFPLPTLYSLSLFTTLTSREVIRNPGSTPWRPTSFTNTRVSQRNDGVNVAVHVDEQSEKFGGLSEAVEYRTTTLRLKGTIDEESQRRTGVQGLEEDVYEGYPPLPSGVS